MRLDRTEERYIEISRGVSTASNIGALAITVCIVIASATSWSRFLLALVLNPLLFGINLGINHVIVPRYGVRGDVVRSLINGITASCVYSLIGWPLPVWFWLPFVAITMDHAAGSRSALAIVLVLAGIQDIAALIDGYWLEPLAFTALAVCCWAIGGARVRIIRDMLARAEQQHDELAATHEALIAEIATRARVELELRQAQKLEALGRMAAGVAHEINTPMQFISDSIQFVRDGVHELLQGEEPDRTYLAEHMPKALELASSGCGRVATIVKSMKLLAHADGEPTPTDLNAAIQATLAVARQEYAAVADIQLDLAPLPLVTCQTGEVGQVLLHLLKNAAHAIEDRIAEAGGRGSIVFTTRADDRRVVITVCDDGCGIAPEIREHVFEPFFTTKTVGRGTGQGLSISRMTIERHGGKLTFDSQPGRGTTFTIALPVTSLPRVVEPADSRRPLAVS